MKNKEFKICSNGDTLLTSLKITPAKQEEVFIDLINDIKNMADNMSLTCTQEKKGMLEITGIGPEESVHSRLFKILDYVNKLNNNYDENAINANFTTKTKYDVCYSCD